MTDSFEVTSLNGLKPCQRMSCHFHNFIGCHNRMQFSCLFHKKLSSDIEITEIEIKNV